MYYLELDSSVALMDMEFLAFQYKRGVYVFKTGQGLAISGPGHYQLTDIFELAKDTLEEEMLAIDQVVRKLNPPVSVLVKDSEFGNTYSTVISDPEEPFIMEGIRNETEAPFHIIRTSYINYIVAFRAERIIKETLFFPMEDFVIRKGGPRVLQKIN